jgi:Glycosyl hydrolase family 26
VLPFVPAQGLTTTNAIQGVRTQDATVAGNTAFETFLTQPVGQVMGFANGATWPAIQSNTAADAAQGATRPIHWSVAMPPTTTLANVAAGVDDANYRTLANTILAARPSDTIIFIRPLWEFNISGEFAWFSVGNEAAYIAAFRRITQIFLNISTKFRFEWCPSFSGLTYDLSLSYPGDQFVDVIGMDCYVEAAIDGTGAGGLFNKFVAPFGLNFLTSFARTHGKAVAIGEWGMNYDNAQLYTSGFAEFLRDQTKLAYQNYFDFDNPNDANFLDRLSLNQYPNTSVRFIKEFSASPPANGWTFNSDFTNAVWTKTAVGAPTTGIADPDGGTAAQQILETATTSEHGIFRNFTEIAGSRTYRIWAKVKPIGNNFARIAAFQNSAADGCSCYFNVQPTSQGGGFNGSFFGFGNIGTPAPFVIPLENNWFKIGIEFTATTNTPLSVQYQCSTGDGNDSYLGNVANGLQVYDFGIRDVT